VSLRWSSAVAQRRALDAGEVSAAELHEEVVHTIERVDPAICAVVVPLFDRRGRGGGVPMLLKDAGQEIAGTPHWVGVAALRDAGAVSPHTTPLVGAFERMGLSIVGKGACPALSTGATTEPAGFAPTRNPWALERSAGGSSGGPAAAVAAGLVPIAHGSDATGSLRCPAALCGVATLNPSSGRVPGGVAPAGQPGSDVWRDFVLSRHAEDLVWAFESLVEGAVVPAASASPLRIGVLDHEPEHGMHVDAACRSGAQVAGRLLESLGHVVSEAWPPALDTMWAEVFPHFAVLSDSTRQPMIDWVSARLGRPVVRGELPDDVFDAAARERPAGDRVVAQAAVDAVLDRLRGWWSTFDVLVTPSTFRTAWPLGGSAGPAEMGTLVAPFSLSGQPALSLPLHWSEDGLPVGVQLVGAVGADELLLRLALDLHEASDWTARRPTGMG
jgi:amidase